MPQDRRQVFLKMLPSNYHEWDTLADTIAVEDWRPLAGRTLLVTARDTVRPIREIAEVLKEHLPGLTWEQIPEGGHMAPLTRPDLVNPLVISHLERFAR
jgi:pimeloyl-ACP methyl ester carboxylesterase